MLTRGAHLDPLLILLPPHLCLKGWQVWVYAGTDDTCCRVKATWSEQGCDKAMQVVANRHHGDERYDLGVLIITSSLSYSVTNTYLVEARCCVFALIVQKFALPGQ